MSPEKENTQGSAGSETLESQFDAAMTRCGLVVPPEWRDGVLAGYMELLRAASLVRQPRMATSEPANVFFLEGVLRDGASR